jgi:cytochrome c oxidase subunit I+III
MTMSQARTGAPYPNPVPRPEGELQALERIWKPPSGLRFLTVVNNTYVGVFYVGTALLFFLLAGVLALLMRTQLAVPTCTTRSSRCTAR